MIMLVLARYLVLPKIADMSLRNIAATVVSNDELQARLPQVAELLNA